VNLDAPDLTPPAVQCAVLDKDPVSGLRHTIKRMEGFYKSRLEQAKDASQKEMERAVQMSVAWDSGFADVKGNELYLLTATSEIGLMSNAPAGRKWVVTKIVHVEGKPVCWCLPVEVKAGEPAKVTLTGDNTFDLAAVFDDALGVTEKAEDKAEKPQEKTQKAADKAEGTKEPSLRKALEKAVQGSIVVSPEDDPDAHALYNQMIQAMRKANSLSYTSHYTWESKGLTLGDCAYHVWLKKPNYFRVEAESAPAKQPEKEDGLWAWLKNFFGAANNPAAQQRKGVLVGDGRTLWIYWPTGRPYWGEDSEADRKTRLTSYMTHPAPPGGHSIGHEVCHLGTGMSMPVIDPSTFHGYTDSLQAYLDYVKGMGMEKVADEECDKIELSIMKHQRIWYLWLSKNDHLPRKLNEIVRVSHDIIINEEWSAVTVNGEIPDTQFAWKPPQDWTPWKMPEPEERLLKPGAKAPDFELASADGEPIKLSSYRGKVVWFYIWRAG
jgi:outer membrane lipoprotein-sorting protein